MAWIQSLHCPVKAGIYAAWMDRDVSLRSYLHDALAYAFSTGCHYWCMICWLLLSRGFLSCGCFCTAAALLLQLLLTMIVPGFCSAVCICTGSGTAHADRLQDWARSDCMHQKQIVAPPSAPGANSMYMTSIDCNLFLASYCHMAVNQ